jgi:hypothetical protein
MLKHKVTNVSKHPKFLTAAGKLLQPGQSVTLNRLDQGTRDDTGFQIEDGEFAKVPAPIKEGPRPVDVDKDDDDDKPIAKVAAEPEGAATLVVSQRRRHSVPLVAVGDDPAPVKASNSTDDDDDGLGDIPKAVYERKDEAPAGFATRPGLSATK